LLAAASWAAGWAQENPIEGEYHFVELQIREGPKAPEAATAAGTLRFAPDGSVTSTLRVGKGRAAMTAAKFDARVQPAGAGVFTIADPAGGPARIEIRASQGILTGASQSPGTHVFFVGVPAPKDTPPVPPRNRYRAAWFALPDGNPAASTTGWLDLEFGDAHDVRQSKLLVHDAAFDDVTRHEELSNVTFRLGPGGTGEFDAGEGSQWLRGKRELLSSPDGGIVLGFSSQPGMRDVLIAVRPEPDATNFSWAGSYWMTGVATAGSYELTGSQPSISSVWGSLVNAGEGTARIQARVASGGKQRRIHTLNAYRIASDGTSMLGRQMSVQISNFVTGNQPPVFLAAQLGPAGELWLEHGLSFGVRTGVAQTMEVEAPVLTHRDGAPVDGARPAKAGELLELKWKPQPGEVEVWIGGIPAEVKRGEKTLVTVPKVKQAGMLPVAIGAGTELFDFATIHVAH
jgi:hypothetical protein